MKKKFRCRTLQRFRAVVAIIVTMLSVLVVGCGDHKKSERSPSDISGEGAEPISIDKYVTTIKDVRTIAERRHPESGGIYWLNGQSLMLIAAIENSDYPFSRGIFLVGLDGSFERLVDLEWKRIQYCLLDNTLHVRTSNGLSKVLPNNSGLNIVIRKPEKLNGRHWSGLKCDYSILPKGLRATYQPLMPEDGILEKTVEDKYLVSNSLTDDSQISASAKRNWSYEWKEQNSGKEIWDLSVVNYDTGKRTDIPGKWPSIKGIQYYSAYNDAYFGYQNKGRCTTFSWLYRENWRVETEQLCLPKWASGGSLIYRPTKVGVLLDHRSGVRPGIHLISKEKEVITLKMGKFRAVSPSPDGCKVAYSEYEPGLQPRREGDFVARLKIMDVCKFIEDKEKTNVTN